MVVAQTGVRAEAVRLSAEHTLFVEGSGEQGLDAVALSVLLPMIRIRTLGPSKDVRSAAEALHGHHPNYYFLVDRDHHDDQTVEQSWNRFPNPNFSNILIWRKRELENYLLDPDYLLKSRFVRCGRDEVCDCVLKVCNERILLEAANLVIVELREAVKRKWIQVFDDCSRFRTRQDAIAELQNRPEFRQFVGRIASATHKDTLENRFEAYVELLTGGKTTLEFGCGEWLERVRGKKVLAPVACRCLRVTKGSRIVQGVQALHALAKELLSLDLSQQPSDFRQLHQLITSRLAVG